jgi:hypothetical protein
MPDAAVGGYGALRGVGLSDGGDVRWQGRDREQSVIKSGCGGIDSLTTNFELV